MTHMLELSALSPQVSNHWLGQVPLTALHIVPLLVSGFWSAGDWTALFIAVVEYTFQIILTSISCSHANNSCDVSIKHVHSQTHSNVNWGVPFCRKFMEYGDQIPLKSMYHVYIGNAINLGKFVMWKIKDLTLNSVSLGQGMRQLRHCCV